MNLLIVESPTKAKTINKYLGKDYKVVASMGHIRDLSSKSGSVLPEENFALTWDISAKAQKNIDNIKKYAKDAENIILATDPDREGEAISWHIYDILQQDKKLKDKNFSRVVFNAITANSVLEAIKHPREIDQNLVEAYLARRSLDYLVGYTLSPVLWRKLPGAKSAGRVQSVALRIICDRENEIEQFISQDYWSIEAILQNQAKAEFSAKLIEYNEQKIEKLSIKNAEQANEIKQQLEQSQFFIDNIEAKQVQRAPSPPFTTSTLQQAAANKLGFSSKITMQIAQKLYEGIEINGETMGLITYIRTDGVQIAPSAIEEARSTIKQKYGTDYLSKDVRIYKTKAKNAQEAHEAIRPTDFSLDYDKVKDYLNKAELELYDLIWKRTIASQMSSAKIDRTTATILAQNNHKSAKLRTTGSVTKFKGFLTVYEEIDKKTEDISLPALKHKEQLKATNIISKQHKTEPPPRYTEASIIKKLEELGIGRPSTYASILSTLREREYIISEKNKLIAESKGRFVTEFLKLYFERYIEYDFTANMEEELDLISDGKLNWKKVLNSFWQDFKQNIENTANLRIGDVIDKLNICLATLLFPANENQQDPHICPACHTGSLSLKLSKFGAFVGCSNYPECSYTRQIGLKQNTQSSENIGEKILGQDPQTQENIELLLGRFGLYLQRGSGKSAKKASIPKDVDTKEITLELAVKLLNLPFVIGQHPETGLPISIGIGRFGGYILYDGKYSSVKSTEKLLNLTKEEALEIIEKKDESTKKTPSKASKIIAEHPKLGKITLHNGRFGYYVKAQKINATIPKNINPEEITEEEAVELIEQKLNKIS